MSNDSGLTKSLNDLFKEVYADKINSLTPNGINILGMYASLEFWLRKDKIRAEDLEKFPKAREAAEIKKTKLWKVLE